MSELNMQDGKFADLRLCPPIEAIFIELPEVAKELTNHMQGWHERLNSYLKSNHRLVGLLF